MKRPRLERPITSGFDEKLLLWIGEQAVGTAFVGEGWEKGAELLAGAGVSVGSTFGDIHELKAMEAKAAGMDLFMHLNYEVKNALETLNNGHADDHGFPISFAYVPSLVFRIRDKKLEVDFDASTYAATDVANILDEIETKRLPKRSVKTAGSMTLESKETYLNDLKLLQRSIQLGEVYQANYCQRFVWNDADLNGAALFIQGHRAFPNPYAVYYKLEAHELLCFSPERFLKIDGSLITSQPMKGTAARSSNAEEDAANKERLARSEKDRRENVMIVDMVRNDLSHFAEKGSVRVPQLYRIESYPKVHQMFSTVEARLKPGTSKIEALLKAFPMGSMTGAPKISAMKLLDRLEHQQRGIFSGTVGFISGKGEADFNVVIRSLIHNSDAGTLMCYAGGGITALSEPEEEYEEAILKAKALIDLVNDERAQKPIDVLPLNNAGSVQ